MNNKPTIDNETNETSKPQGLITTLKFMAINANSLQHNVRRFELHKRLEQYNPDIVLISETKLNSSHCILSHKYEVIRTDRLNFKQGGGTAILIKNHINHQVIRYQSSLKNEILEFTIIQLLQNTDSNKKIFVISSYATNSNRKTFIQELDDVLQRLDLSNADHFFILAGDLNARRMEWGDTADNQRGKFLRTWEAESIDAYRASIYTTDVASFKTGSFLDVCISNVTLTGLTSKNKITTADYDSDHRALLFTAILPHEVQTGADIQIPRRNLRAIKWKKFEKTLNNEYTQELANDKNLTIEEIDDGITNLTSALVNTINKTAPIVKKK